MKPLSAAGGRPSRRRRRSVPASPPSLLLPTPPHGATPYEKLHAAVTVTLAVTRYTQPGRRLPAGTTHARVRLLSMRTTWGSAAAAAAAAAGGTTPGALFSSPHSEGAPTSVSVAAVMRSVCPAGGTVVGPAGSAASPARAPPAADAKALPPAPV